jgi:hypothetical protein
MAVDKWFAGWERSFSLRELRARMQELGLSPVHAYGEWMVPSFFYRSFREAVKAAGITLPRHPQPVEGLSRMRKNFRMALLGTPLPKYTGFNIGVVGRK